MLGSPKMQPLHVDHVFDNTYAKIMKSPLNRSIPVELMTVALSMFYSKIDLFSGDFIFLRIRIIEHVGGQHEVAASFGEPSNMLQIESNK